MPLASLEPSPEERALAVEVLQAYGRGCLTRSMLRKLWKFKQKKKAKLQKLAKKNPVAKLFLDRMVRPI